MHQTAQIGLLSGALDNLIHHTLTGCGQSAQRAIILLSRLESALETDSELQDACQRMREHLEDGDV